MKKSLNGLFVFTLTLGATALAGDITVVPGVPGAPTANITIEKNTTEINPASNGSLAGLLGRYPDYFKCVSVRDDDEVKFRREHKPFINHIEVLPGGQVAVTITTFEHGEIHVLTCSNIVVRFKFSNYGDRDRRR